MSNEDAPAHRSTGTTGRAAYPPDRTGPGHAETTHARAGETRHVVRYVLAASLLLVVLLFAVIVLWGTSNAPDGKAGDGQASPSEVTGGVEQPENMRNKAPKTDRDPAPPAASQ